MEYSLFTSLVRQEGNVKKQFLDEISIRQTSFHHFIGGKDSVTHCVSKCEMAVSPECLIAQEASDHLPLRAGTNYLEDSVQGIRTCALVLTLDCESGNKTAFELIINDDESHRLSPRFITSARNHGIFHAI